MPLVLTNETIGSTSAIMNLFALINGSLPDGDICSAFDLISMVYSRLLMFKKAWTVSMFALSGNRTCSTSKGWYSWTSVGHGSEAIK